MSAPKRYAVRSGLNGQYLAGGARFWGDEATAISWDTKAAAAYVAEYEGRNGLIKLKVVELAK